MRDRVVVKWGGGLITTKDQLKTVRSEVISQLSRELLACLSNGIDIILVHGAGSYGHLKAKEHRLAEGRIEGNTETIERQRNAVRDVQLDMMELNDHVIQALTALDVSAVTLHPHRWATNTGLNFHGDLSSFCDAPGGIVLVTHGDVVPCDEPREFGILSGDDLAVRLAVEVPGVKRLVFAMSGADGVLDRPPTEDGAKLIPVLKADDVFIGHHAQSIDVTGGIGYKVAQGFVAAKHGIDVWLVNGETQGRVVAACRGEPVVGTILQA